MLRKTSQDLEFPDLGRGRFNCLPYEDGLLEAAQMLLAPADELLRDVDAPLLTIAWDRRSAAPVARLLPWRAGPSLGPDLSPTDASTPSARNALLAVMLHGRQLCMMLARRWPANAAPPIIGVVTDGTGIAISQDHPSATDPQWLVDHFDGHAPAAALVPFAVDAAFLSLIAPPATLARH